MRGGGGWAPNLACSWAGASQNDEWRPLWRFWYQSTSWLHFPAPPEKAIWALFNSVSHKHQLHLISLVYWRRWRQQQSGCFPHFFFSSFNFRCEYWCQSGEGHRHRTLRHLLQPPAVLLQQPCMKPAICNTSPSWRVWALVWASQHVCFFMHVLWYACVCVCVLAVEAMHEVLNLRHVCWWHSNHPSKTAICSHKQSGRHFLCCTTSAVRVPIL